MPVMFSPIDIHPITLHFISIMPIQMLFELCSLNLLLSMFSKLITTPGITSLSKKKLTKILMKGPCCAMVFHCTTSTYRELRWAPKPACTRAYLPVCWHSGNFSWLETLILCIFAGVSCVEPSSFTVSLSTL